MGNNKQWLANFYPSQNKISSNVFYEEEIDQIYESLVKSALK